MKAYVCAMLGLIGTAIIQFIGDIDVTVKCLICLMVCDFVLGIVAAGVFHTSTKSNHGSLSSIAGFKGILRKCIILAMVGIGNMLDQALNSEIIRTSIIFGFSANELISIVENLGLCGVKVPSVIRKAIDILNDKAEDIDNVRGN